MARLISATVYAHDSSVYASASPMAIGTDSIIVVQNASAANKKSNPAASGSINSRIVTNSLLNNEGQQHVYLVGETIATLVTASA
jgi:hypothetical protein